MALSEYAREVISRKIPTEKIKQRPGGRGMVFDYVTQDFVVETLNEAFGGSWSMRITDHLQIDNAVIVGVELMAHDENNMPIIKQQFGCCNITSGLAAGEAFKGAASDGLKKAATLFGVALELYQDDEVTPNKPSPPVGAVKPTPPVRPAASRPPRPATVSAPPSPPKPPAPRTPHTTPRPPGQFPNGAPVAQVPKPTPTPQASPFGGGKDSAGPSSTQLSAMTSIAARLNKSQAELIALANITDAAGGPLASFEDLTSQQAIKVIVASQK